MTNNKINGDNKEYKCTLYIWLKFILVIFNFIFVKLNILSFFFFFFFEYSKFQILKN